MYWLHWLVWGLLFGIGIGLFLLKHTLVVLSEALRLTPAPPPAVRAALRARHHARRTSGSKWTIFNGSETDVIASTDVGRSVSVLPRY